MAFLASTNFAISGSFSPLATNGSLYLSVLEITNCRFLSILSASLPLMPLRNGVNPKSAAETFNLTVNNRSNNEYFRKAQTIKYTKK